MWDFKISRGRYIDWRAMSSKIYKTALQLEQIKKGLTKTRQQNK